MQQLELSLLVICTCWILCAASAHPGGNQQATHDVSQSSAELQQAILPHGRALLSDASKPGCGPLTKELVARYAVDNTVMVMACDKLLFKRLSKTWVESLRSAGITYYLLAALDPWTSRASALTNITQCFEHHEPGEHAGHTEYVWGSKHWHATTWKKVHIVRAIYALGFDVIHTDADSTWFRDPLPWIRQHFRPSRAKVMFSIDSLETENKAGDEGPEASATPYFNINTGIYFIKQWPQGLEFLDVWMSEEPREVGHDQDGLNNVVRGFARNSEARLPHPVFPILEPNGTRTRMIGCAMHNTTEITYLPVHIVGNSYTYSIARPHEQLRSNLLAIHWVWTGGTPECKIQNIRNALKYEDAPEWYGLSAAPGDPDMSPHYPSGPAGPLMLISIELEVPKAPPGFNQLALPDTEQMIQFHLNASNWQLQQAYWGILAAAGLNRVFILPPFECFCTKNWYMTQACRINGEHHTQFPYKCNLADLLRARKVLSGISIHPPNHAAMTVYTREWPFLSNPRVAPEIKSSRLVLRPSQSEARIPDQLDQASWLPVKQDDGSHVLHVPGPLNTDQLKLVIQNAVGGPWRVVHLINASQIVGAGFADADLWQAFDNQIAAYKTYWCCRSPDDQNKFNKPANEPYQIVPASRAAAASHAA